MFPFGCSMLLMPVLPLWRPAAWLQKRFARSNACNDDDDLSADGPIARRIRADLAKNVPLPDSRFRCAPTGDGRGLGLFVAGQPIESGTYLFDYKGRLREEGEHTKLYPIDTARSNYSVGIMRADETSVYVDATDPAVSNLARYMNHAEAAVANVVAWTIVEPHPRVIMFAGRALLPGEEMVWDYGQAFWAGREDERL